MTSLFCSVATFLLGGECILSMSNRCFPTKAFRIWLQTSDLEHIFIAGSFFHYSGLFDPPAGKDMSPNPGRSDPLFIVSGKRKAYPGNEDSIV
jgi:hypothetical protein